MSISESAIAEIYPPIIDGSQEDELFKRLYKERKYKPDRIFERKSELKFGAHLNDPDKSYPIDFGQITRRISDAKKQLKAEVELEGREFVDACCYSQLLNEDGKIYLRTWITLLM